MLCVRTWFAGSRYGVTSKGVAFRPIFSKHLIGTEARATGHRWVSTFDIVLFVGTGTIRDHFHWFIIVPLSV